MPSRSVAIAHDYVTQRGGAEKVVLALTRGFPDSTVHTTLYEQAATYPEFASVSLKPGMLNRVGLFRRNHRLAIPFLAWAVRRECLDADVTIVSSSGWAHGYRSRGPKIVYCYSPARWLYQTEAYLGDGANPLVRLALGMMKPFLRRWDRKQAGTAAKYFAISTVVRDRIRDAYGIDAEILPAPHTFDASGPQDRPAVLPQVVDRFYLCISRLLPYKNVDKVVSAFAESETQLVVVGAGPEEKSLRAMATGNVHFLSNLSDAEMRWLYAHCTALIAASYEDFGLTPIEAAAFGKPSVVLRWGGFLDTLNEGVSGVYFDEPTPELIREAVQSSAQMDWNAERIREHSETFSEDRFIERLRQEVDRLTPRIHGSS